MVYSRSHAEDQSHADKRVRYLVHGDGSETYIYHNLETRNSHYKNIERLNGYNLFDQQRAIAEKHRRFQSGKALKNERNVRTVYKIPTHLATQEAIMSTIMVVLFLISGLQHQQMTKTSFMDLTQRSGYFYTRAHHKKRALTPSPPRLDKEPDPKKRQHPIKFAIKPKPRLGPRRSVLG